MDTINSQVISDLKPQVAYLSMEFALQDDFHIYSGGLGVLAGDYLLEANAQNWQILGVSLKYDHSLQQEIIEEKINYFEQAIEIHTQRLMLLVDSHGHPLEVMIPTHWGEIWIRAWVKRIGNNYLLLLDTNYNKNPNHLREITDHLYGGDHQHRLLQELVLGVGGVKILHSLNLQPLIHLNEGHAALASLALMGAEQARQPADLSELMNRIKSKIVFTNHTLIPAGHDSFSLDLMRQAVGHCCDQAQLHLEKVFELGKAKGKTDFSLTIFALNTAGASSAVSHYHATKAAEMWPEFQMIPITNGIHLPRWYARELDALWPLTDEAPAHPAAIWHSHQERKAQLLQVIKKLINKNLTENTLVVTWARRFVDYKRPEVLFWRMDWLEKILTNSPIPVHFLFAGKNHPHDKNGQAMIEHVLKVSHDSKFSPYISYLPGYDLELAEQLVQGSDVWLNTPVEGYEACGTSGMKAALNGVLQCTTNDGWVREANLQNIGWLLNSATVSESLYQVLEKQIIPLYLERDANMLPQAWIDRMVKSSQVIRQQFSTARMGEEYWQQLYQLKHT